MKIMIFAGEPSGDYYGANLLKALQSLNSSIEAFGFGSQQMKKAGFDVIFDPTELSVVGITEALKQIGFFRNWLKRLEVIMKERKRIAWFSLIFQGSTCVWPSWPKA